MVDLIRNTSSIDGSLLLVTFQGNVNFHFSTSSFFLLVLDINQLLYMFLLATHVTSHVSRVRIWKQFFHLRGKIAYFYVGTSCTEMPFFNVQKRLLLCTDISTSNFIYLNTRAFFFFQLEALIFSFSSLFLWSEDYY